MMTWLDHDDIGRPLTAVMWFGSAVITWTWRFGSKGIPPTYAPRQRTMRQRTMQPRLGRVSLTWLDEYVSESAKHVGHD